MLRYLCPAAVLLLVPALVACVSINTSPFASETVVASGRIQTETRTIRGVDAVELVSPGVLKIEQGAEESLAIEADDNLLPLITSEVRGGRLVLSFKDTINIRNPSKLEYHLKVRSLEAIIVSGAGDIEATGIDTARLTVRIEGAGSLRLSGHADDQEVYVSGAGDYNAQNLTSQRATIVLDGLGGARVRVNDRLIVTVNGMGAVDYYGSPEVVQEINGMGTVRQAGK